MFSFGFPRTVCFKDSWSTLSYVEIPKFVPSWCILRLEYMLLLLECATHSQWVFFNDLSCKIKVQTICLSPLSPCGQWRWKIFSPLSSKIFQCGDLKHCYPFSLKLLSFTKLFLMFRTVWIRKIEGPMISHKCLTEEELLVAFIKVSIFCQWYGLYSSGTRIPYEGDE